MTPSRKSMKTLLKKQYFKYSIANIAIKNTAESIIDSIVAVISVGKQNVITATNSMLN